MNYADLPPNLVPRSEWNRECSYWSSSVLYPESYYTTIFDEFYNPRLYPPEFLRNLDLAWRSCDFPAPGNMGDTFDPPHALDLLPSLVMLTMSHDPTPDPPSPGQSIKNPPSRTTRSVFNPPVAISTFVPIIDLGVSSNDDHDSNGTGSGYHQSLGDHHANGGTNDNPDDNEDLRKPSTMGYIMKLWLK